MNTQINQEQEDKIREAFRCVVSLCCASHENNHASCGSFHIQPFNTHWDKKTVEEVLYHVQLYARTWILSPLQTALNLDSTIVEDKMMIQWHEGEAARLKHKISLKS